MATQDTPPQYKFRKPLSSPLVSVVSADSVSGLYDAKCKYMMSACDSAWERMRAEHAATSLAMPSEYSLFAVDGVTPDYESLGLWRKSPSVARDVVAKYCEYEDAVKLVSQSGRHRVILAPGSGKTTVLAPTVAAKVGGVVIVVEPDLIQACSAFLSTLHPAGLLVYGDKPSGPGLYYASAAYCCGNLSWINTDAVRLVVVDECDDTGFYVKLALDSLVKTWIVEMSGSSDGRVVVDAQSFSVSESELDCGGLDVEKVVMERAAEVASRYNKVMVVLETADQAKKMSSRCGWMECTVKSSSRSVVSAMAASSGVVVTDASVARGVNMAVDAMVAVDVIGDGVDVWASTNVSRRQRKRRLGRLRPGEMWVVPREDLRVSGAKASASDALRNAVLDAMVRGDGEALVTTGSSVCVVDVFLAVTGPWHISQVCEFAKARDAPDSVVRRSVVSGDPGFGVVTTSGRLGRQECWTMSLVTMQRNLDQLTESVYLTPMAPWTDFRALRMRHWPSYARSRLRSPIEVIDRESDEECVMCWNWAVVNKKLLGLDHPDCKVCFSWARVYMNYRIDYFELANSSGPAGASEFYESWGAPAVMD